MNLEKWLIIFSSVCFIASLFIGGYLVYTYFLKPQVSLPKINPDPEQLAMPEVFQQAPTTTQCTIGFAIAPINTICSALEIRNQTGAVIQPDQVSPNDQLTLAVQGRTENTTLPIADGRIIVGTQTLTTTKDASNSNRYSASYSVPNNLSSISVRGDVKHPLTDTWVTSAACTVQLGPQLSYTCGTLSLLSETGTPVLPNAVAPGQRLRLRVTGSTNSTEFTRGQFKIGTNTVEGTRTAPNTFEFTNYTATSGSQNITAQVFHPISNQWHTNTTCAVTVVPQVYACVDIAASSPAVSRGAALPTYTCRATGNAGRYARFQVVHTAGDVLVASQNVALANNQATWNGNNFVVPNTAPDGNYQVQCRICDVQDRCTDWGVAQAQ